MPELRSYRRPDCSIDELHGIVDWEASTAVELPLHDLLHLLLSTRRLRTGRELGHIICEQLRSLHTDDLAWITDSLEPSADVELVRELGLRQPAGRTQALHGDAHLANCLPGPLWHDFETACRGPRELDLAALGLSARVRGDDASRIALEAYGDHDGGLLEECLPIYAAWVYASFMIALPRRPELGPVLAERLGWLRETYT